MLRWILNLGGALFATMYFLADDGHWTQHTALAILTWALIAFVAIGYAYAIWASVKLLSFAGANTQTGPWVDPYAHRKSEAALDATGKVWGSILGSLTMNVVGALIGWAIVG